VFAWWEIVPERLVKVVGELVAASEVFTGEVGDYVDKQFGEEEYAMHGVMTFWLLVEKVGMLSSSTVLYELRSNL
jgi:hypothetical protein